ncbi:MAG: HesA/MoeB/ThiF family protein [Armatimonadetes bacterium]|nr:HesA/MoeB/ThiF family protein [Armatimonadota bacterium]
MIKFPFSEQQIKRYSRQIILSEVGGKGQKKISQSKILIIGIGALGSIAAYYLSGAGIGTLGLADCEKVELSNLHRQIIHNYSDLGKLKVNSAYEKLKKINQEVNFKIYPEKLTSKNGLKIIQEFDLILDGSDNLKTRFLINDACVLLNKPLFYGAVFGFEGQATTIIPHKGPCLRCFLKLPIGLILNCEETGVLGVLPGFIGIIQATEALKFILNKGNLLLGNLLIYDALKMQFNKIKIKRDLNCILCGKNSKIKKLKEEYYERKI